MNDNRPPRWKAIVLYRTGSDSFVDVEHFFEEIQDLHQLIERGPHWDTLIRCTVTLNRPAENKHLTIQQAERL